MSAEDRVHEGEAERLEALLLCGDELSAAERSELEVALARCPELRAWAADVEAMSAALSLWRAPEPEAASWRAMRAQVELEVADAGALGGLLDLVEVPPPEPRRWAEMSARIKEEVAGELRIGPASAGRPSRAWLWQAAAGLALMVCGALAASSWPSPAASREVLASWRRSAEAAIDAGQLERAERLLVQALEDGSGCAEGHDLLERCLSDLEALRAWRTLPTGEAREASLASFIYRHPEARVTGRALRELVAQRRPGAAAQARPVEDFDNLPRMGSEGVIALRDQRQEYLAIIRGGEAPGAEALADAARVQLALLELESGQSLEARTLLREVRGASPAARFAQELLERLDERP